MDSLWKLIYCQIFAWMERVTRGEAGGPQSADATTREVLAAIYGNIRKLSYVCQELPSFLPFFPYKKKVADCCKSLPDGLIYRATGIQPNSHIVRLLNRAWGNGSNQELSKFLVGAWPFAPASDRDGRVPGWFNPYDLLGLFLSLLGPTSEAADQENYFLPLTAVYARWCTRIAGNKPGRWKWKPTDPGVGDWPFMFQCTWNLIEDSNKKRSHWFFLGASTAGDKFDANAVGGWRREVQRERFGMLFGCQRQPLVQRMDFEENKAPSQLMPGGSQVPYGNCAETYPFVAMVQA